MPYGCRSRCPRRRGPRWYGPGWRPRASGATRSPGGSTPSRRRSRPGEPSGSTNRDGPGDASGFRRLGGMVTTLKAVRERDGGGAGVVGIVDEVARTAAAADLWSEDPVDDVAHDLAVVDRAQHAVRADPGRPAITDRRAAIRDGERDPVAAVHGQRGAVLAGDRAERRVVPPRDAAPRGGHKYDDGGYRPQCPFHE